MKLQLVGSPPIKAGQAGYLPCVALPANTKVPAYKGGAS